MKAFHDEVEWSGILQPLKSLFPPPPSPQIGMQTTCNFYFSPVIPPVTISTNRILQDPPGTMFFSKNKEQGTLQSPLENTINLT